MSVQLQTTLEHFRSVVALLFPEEARAAVKARGKLEPGDEAFDGFIEMLKQGDGRKVDFHKLCSELEGGIVALIQRCDALISQSK